MLMSPNKKIATIIVSKIGKKDNEDKKPDFIQKIGEVSESNVESSKPEQDNDIALEAAAEDVIKAIQDNKPKMLVEAMKNLMEMCAESKDEEENEDY